MTINVISTYNPNVLSITPSSGTSHGNIYLGLIEQFHYVGFDKMACSIDLDCGQEVLGDALRGR